MLKLTDFNQASFNKEHTLLQMCWDRDVTVPQGPEDAET